MRRAIKYPTRHPLDIPAFLRIPQDVRRRAWNGVPVTVVAFVPDKPRGEDAATAAFRAQMDEERRQKALARVSRMKTHMASKVIDYTKMRWDPRICKFVEDKFTRILPPAMQAAVSKGAVFTPAQPKGNRIMTPTDWNEVGAKIVKGFNDPVNAVDWSRVNKDNARALAELNGVWKDQYAKLSAGLLVMSVTNRLKGLVKNGGMVKWQ